MTYSAANKPPSFDTSIKYRLVIKIALFFSVLTFAAIAASGFFHYNKNIDLILRNLQNQLQLAANTIAISINGDAYQTLRGKASINTPEYHEIRMVLKEFYESNENLGFDPDCIYTFRKISEDSLEFTVMLHDQYVGNRYAIRPEMRPTFAAGTSAFTGIYEDENGTWVSAYAPIYNRNREIVGIVEVDFKDNVYLMALTDEKYSILLFSLGGIFLVIIGAILTSRYITRPIRKISQAAIQLASGDLNARVHIKGRNEIGMLGRAFNYMVAEINEKELIRSKNEELQAAYQKLDTMNKKLQEANHLKTEFLNIAAHDLKNPLQAILGYAEMVLDTADQQSRVYQAADKMHSITQRMFGIISHLIDKSAMEEGAILLSKEKADICEIARQVIQQNQHLAQRKNQQLHHTTNGKCEADVDKIRMYEILDNLVSNAIKFSPPGKDIQVQVKKFKNQGKSKEIVQIAIKDKGLGLSYEDLRNMFKKNQPLSSKPTGGESSTGLGLCVVKHLVTLHGGRIWAESPGKGKGASFFVELDMMN